MSWLGKQVGNRVSGTSKWLGKTIKNGTDWLHKANRVIGSVKDRYSMTKKGIIEGAERYSPILGNIAKEGIKFLEGEAQAFIDPVVKQAQPILSLGSGLSRALQSYG